MRTNAVGEIPNQRLWNIAAKQSSEAARSWAVSYCSQFTANASHAPECTTWSFACSAPKLGLEPLVVYNKAQDANAKIQV